MSTGRFRLALTARGRPIVRGWWADEATARRKYRTWIGEYGSIPGARITLTDEGDGSTLTTWPKEP